MPVSTTSHSSVQESQGTESTRGTQKAGISAGTVVVTGRSTHKVNSNINGVYVLLPERHDDTKVYKQLMSDDHLCIFFDWIAKLWKIAEKPTAQKHVAHLPAAHGDGTPADS